MESVLRDLHHGLKLLLRDRAFSLAVLLTLGVAVGANVAVYSVVHSVVLRPLPFHEPERLVRTFNFYPGLGVGREQAGASSADFFHRRARVAALEEVALYQAGGATVRGDEDAERVAALRATPSLFPLLGVAAVLGRVFLEEEMAPGAEPTVLLTHGYWRDRFAGSAQVLGETVRVDGVDRTIVGVLPPGFRMAEHPDARLVLPIVFSTQQQTTLAGWHNNIFQMLARMAPGATPEQVEAELALLNAALMEEAGNPQWLANTGYRTVVADAQADLVRGVRPVLFLLWAGVAFVLLIGSVNVANLMLARAQARLRELATRLALGAKRARLARQVLTESALIGMVGVAAGVVLGWAGLRLFGAVGIGDLPRGGEIALDLPVLVYTVCIALAASLLIGALPVGHLFRTDLGGAFRAESRGGTAGRRTTLLRSGLVAAQVCLAFLLLVGAGLMLRSFRAALEVDPGFAAEGVFTGQVALTGAGYAEAEARRRFLDELLAQLRAMPGVAAASITTALPFGGGGGDSPIMPEGYEPGPGESLVSPRFAIAGPGYFETLGIPVQEGRTFDERDRPGEPYAVVIDRWLAQRYWPDRSPLGHRMVRGDEAYTVVGVVETIKHTDLTARESEHVGAYYFSHQQFTPGLFTVVARAAQNPLALTAGIRAAMNRIDPEVPLYDVQALDERITASLGPRRTPMVLLLVMAGIAIFLAVVGIYGVLAYTVSQRTREIGIRIALGSQPTGIMALVLRQGMTMTAIGLAAGGVAALYLVQLIQSLLFGVQPTDPLVLAGTAALLAAAAAAACMVPAWRAARVDPLSALARE